MSYQIEICGNEYILTVGAIDLEARFPIADVDIMTKFIQSLVLNVSSY